MYWCGLLIVVQFNFELKYETPESPGDRRVYTYKTVIPGIFFIDQCFERYLQIIL